MKQEQEHEPRTIARNLFPNQTSLLTLTLFVTIADLKLLLDFPFPPNTVEYRGRFFELLFSFSD